MPRPNFRALRPSASRLARAAWSLPELWVALVLGLAHAAIRPWVPVEWTRSLGWEVHPYQLFATLAALALFMSPGAMLVRLLRVGGGWATRLPTYFAAALGVWSVPGLWVAFTAQHDLRDLIAVGAGITALIALAALARGLRSPAHLDDARDEGREDPGERWNPGLAFLGLSALAIMAWMSLNAPVTLDDNLQLGYVQDNMVVPHINEFEPVFGAGIRPNTRGSLTTWPLNLAVIARFSGLPPQAAFWLLRTPLVLLDLLGVYALALRLFGGRNRALLAALAFCLVAVVFSVEQDSIGFGLFGRTAQDKFVVRYTLLPITLAWSLAYLKRPGRSAFWLAGILTLGQAATHTIGAIVLGIPLTGLGLAHILGRLQGVPPWPWPPPWRWRLSPRAIGTRLQAFIRLNWPVARPFVCLAAFSIGSLAVPAIQQASPDAPVVAYSLTDTRDPSLWYRINLVISNYRLLIANGLGDDSYIVHPRIFLSPLILLPALGLPFVAWRSKNRWAAELLVGTFVLNPVLLLVPPVIQFIGARATPWLLYRFAWPLTLLGPIALGWAGWALVEHAQGRVPVRLRGALPPAAVVIAAAALAMPLRNGWNALAELRSDPVVSRCRTLQPLLSQLPEAVGAGTVVLSTPDMDMCIPAAAAHAYPVEFFLTSTINRFPQSRIPEAQRRFADVHAFSASRVVDREFMDTLARWNVGLILLRQDQPIESQLRHMPWLFRLEYEVDRYRVYRVLTGDGIGAWDEAEASERWAQARWTGDDPLVLANSLWTEGRWSEAVAAYRAIAEGYGPARFLALVGEGRAQQSAGRLDDAIAAYRTAAEADASDSRLWLLLADAHWLNGDYAQFAQAAEQAVGQLSWHPEALRRLADAYRLLGRLDDAIAAYERAAAAEAAPGSSTYYRTLGSTFLAVNWLPEAIAALQRSLSLRESNQTYFYLSDAFDRLGNPSAARGAAERSHRFEFWSDLPYLSLGGLAVDEGDSELALQHFRQAAVRNPQSPGVQRLAATADFARGNEEALTQIEALVGYRLGFSEPLLTAARQRLSLGDIEAAQSLSAQAWSWGPMNSSAAVLLGNLRHALGLEDEAAGSYRQALAVNPLDTGAYTGLAALAEGHGEWGTAVGWKWWAMEAAPYSSTTVASLGDTYAARGDFDRAFSTYHQAMRVDPLDPAPHLAMGELMRLLGQSPEPPSGMDPPAGHRAAGAVLASTVPSFAVSDPHRLAAESFETAARLEVQGNRAVIGLGHLARDAGRLDEAIDQFRRAVEISPFDGAGLVALGQVLEQAGKKEEARQAFERAVESDPGYIAGYDALGALFMGRGQRDEATEAYQLAITRLPWRADGYLDLGALMEKLGRRELARDVYQIAANLQPRQASPAWAALASLAQVQGDWDEAERLYRQATSADPTWTLALGRMYQAMGRRDDAREQYLLATGTLPAPGQSDAFAALASLSMIEGRLTQAVEEARTAIGYSPVNLPAYATLAKAYRHAGQPEQSTGALDWALSAMPGSSDALMIAGAFRGQRGEWAAAFDDFAKARELDRGSPAPWVSTGEAHRARAQYLTAIQDYERALFIDPSSVEAWLGLGQAFTALARYDEAARAFRQAADWDRSRVEGLLALGDLEAKRHRLDDAIAEYRQAVEIRPTEPQAYVSLADLYRSQGDVVEAEGLLRRAVTLAPASGTAWLALAHHQWSQGDLSAAGDSFERAVSVDPANLPARAELGAFQWKQGRFDEAERTFRAAIAANAADPLGYVHLGRLLQARGDFAGARGILLAGTRANPGDGATLNELGDFYFQRGETELAFATFRRAIQVDPARTDAYLSLASAYFNAGLLADAEAAARLAIQVDASDGRAYALLGDFERAAGRLNSAEAFYRTGTELDPSHLANYAGLGGLFTQLGRADDALAVYDSAVSLQPGSSDALLLKGDHLRSRGQWQAAMALYESARDLNRGSVAPWLALGEAYRGRVDYTRAADAFQQAARLEPGSPDGGLALARLQQAQARIDEALRSFGAAAALDHTRVEAWLAAGELHAARGDADDAAGAFEHAIRLRPADPAGYLGAGQFHQAQGEVERATSLLEAAVKVAPASGPAWQALGDARLAQGDIAGARAAYQTAVERMPGYAPGHLALGDLWRAQGEKQKAVSEYRAAIAVDASDPDGYVSLGQWLQSQALFEDAESQLKAGTEAVPGSGSVWVAWGSFLASRNRPGEAIAALEQAIEIEPTFLGGYTRPVQTGFLSQPLMGLAQVHQSLAQFPEAEAVLRRALEVDASAPDAHVGLAALYVQTNRPSDANEILEDALGVIPGSPFVLMMAGDVALWRGNLTHAVEQYTHAASLQPGIVEPYLALADAYERGAQWAKAVEAYQSAIEMSPADPRPRIGLAAHYLGRAQSAEAEDRARQALELSPASGAAWLALGDSAAQSGDLRQALAYYQTAVLLERTYAAGYRALGDGYRILGEMSNAEGAYLLGIERAPTQAENYVALGQFLLDRGQTNPALGILAQATAAMPASGEAWHELGAVAVLAGKFDAASANYAQGIRVAPTSDLNYLGLGQLRIQRLDYAGAEQTFRQGLAARPTSGRLHSALGSLFRRTGASGQARDEFRLATAAAPADAQGYVEYARFLMAQGEVYPALEQYQTATGIGPRSGQAWSGLGDVYLHLGRYTEAASAYRFALTLEAGELISAYGGLDSVYALLGSPGLALDGYRAAAAAFPGFALPQWGIASFYRGRGDLDSAIRYYSGALGLEPGDVQARADLAAVHQLRGDWGAAKAEYDRAIAIQPGNPLGRLALGDGWLAQGQYDRASAEYTAAIALDGASALPYLSLGVLAEARGDGSTAVAHYRQAMSVDPTNIDAPLAMAGAYYRMGDTAGALGAYWQATLVDRSQSEPWISYGQITLSQGTHSPDAQMAAQTNYWQALAVEPGNPESRVQLAALYQLQGLSTDAEGQLASAMAQAPGYSPAYAMRGGWWAAQSKFNEAIADLEKAVQLDPTNIAAVDQLALVFDNYHMYVNPPCQTTPLGETVCAPWDPSPPSALPDRTPVYEAMSAGDPSAAWLHGILANFYQRSVVLSPSAAARHYEVLVARYPEFAEFHRRLALAYESLNRTSDAARQWTLYLALAFRDPERPVAQASFSHLALIIHPVTVEAWNPLVPVRGSAATVNFKSYQLHYGEGPTPTEWRPVTGPVFTPVYNDVLGTWDTTALPNGTYTIRLTVTDAFDLQSWYFVNVTLAR